MLQLPVTMSLNSLFEHMKSDYPYDVENTSNRDYLSNSFKFYLNNIEEHNLTEIQIILIKNCIDRLDEWKKYL